MTRRTRHEFNQLEIPNVQVLMDPDAFEDEIDAHGVPLVHYRALRCPLGLADPGDLRRPHVRHDACSNGFLYRRAGTVVGLFTGNGLRMTNEDPGWMMGSTAQVTVRRVYQEDCARGRVGLAPYDRLYAADEKLVTECQELFAHDPSGVDRLSRPAVEVLALVDADGVEYAPCGDFAIQDGRLVWGARRPGVDSRGNGRPCSVRYTYRPYYYVSHLVHELRFVTTPEGTVQQPQAAQLVREYVYENVAGDARGEARAETLAPTAAEFGPR